MDCSHRTGPAWVDFLGFLVVSDQIKNRFEVAQGRVEIGKAFVDTFKRLLAITMD